MLGTIPSQGCQLSLLRTFWYQNELPKSFGSQDRILPKYGHGRGRFGIFRKFLKFSNMPSKQFCLLTIPSEFSCKGLSAYSIQASFQSMGRVGNFFFTFRHLQVETTYLQNRCFEIIKQNCLQLTRKPCHSKPQFDLKLVCTSNKIDTIHLWFNTFLTFFKATEITKSADVSF